MTVADLMVWLSDKDPSAEVLYYSFEAGEDVPLSLYWISVEEPCESEESES